MAAYHQAQVRQMTLLRLKLRGPQQRAAEALAPAMRLHGHICYESLRKLRRIVGHVGEQNEESATMSVLFGDEGHAAKTLPAKIEQPLERLYGCIRRDLADRRNRVQSRLAPGFAYEALVVGARGAHANHRLRFRSYSFSVPLAGNFSLCAASRLERRATPRRRFDFGRLASPPILAALPQRWGS